MDPTPTRLTRAQALSLAAAAAGGVQQVDNAHVGAGAGTTTPKPGVAGRAPRAAAPLGERTNQVSGCLSGRGGRGGAWRAGAGARGA